MERREGRKDGKRKKRKEPWEISVCQIEMFTQPARLTVGKGIIHVLGYGAREIKHEVHSEQSRQAMIHILH